MGITAGFDLDALAQGLAFGAVVLIIVWANVMALALLRKLLTDSV